MAKQVVILLAQGFEEIEAVTQIDVLRRAGLEVTVAGLGGREIQGAHALTLRADIALTELSTTPDAVVLPGGMPGSKNLGESKTARQLAERVASAGGICAAICAAPALTLAPWGLLKGKTATCYPGFEKEFSSDTTFSEERVVVDGTVITSRGPGTALEFALALVEQLVDQSTREDLASGMLAVST